MADFAGLCVPVPRELGPIGDGVPGEGSGTPLLLSGGRAPRGSLHHDNKPKQPPQTRISWLGPCLESLTVCVLMNKRLVLELLFWNLGGRF